MGRDVVDEGVEACLAVDEAEEAEEAEEVPPPAGPLVVTERGVAQSPVAREPSVFYSPELAEKIYELYVSGMALYKISRVQGMPSYGSILRWYKDNKDFRSLLEGGRALRALHHEEQALKAAEEPTSKDDVPAARLKFDAHVWAAEVHDPSKYGKKTTVQGDPNRPIVFQIVTGVPEPDDKRTIELNADGTVKEKA